MKDTWTEATGSVHSSMSITNIFAVEAHFLARNLDKVGPFLKDKHRIDSQYRRVIYDKLESCLRIAVGELILFNTLAAKNEELLQETNQDCLEIVKLEPIGRRFRVVDIISFKIYIRRLHRDGTNVYFSPSVYNVPNDSGAG